MFDGNKSTGQLWRSEVNELPFPVCSIFAASLPDARILPIRVCVCVRARVRACACVFAVYLFTSQDFLVDKPAYVTHLIVANEL